MRLLRHIGPLAGILGLVVLAGGSAVAQEATAVTPLNTNLVTNSKALPRPGVVPDGYALVDIPNWRRVGNFTLAPYGSGGFPELSEAKRIGGGKYFFSGGPDNTASRAYQVIKISGRNAAIDAGRLKLNVAAWLGNWDGQRDSARVAVDFLDAGGDVLGTIRTVAVSVTGSTFSRKTATGTLPKGTRQVKVILLAARGDGIYCDGYFDNVDVRLALK
jgi:hypothetical protein